MRKSQVALEYLIAVALGFTLLMIFAAYISGEITVTTEEREISLVKDLAMAVQKEIYLASEVEMGYRRDFSIPDDLEGTDYTIENSEKTLILRTDNYDIALTIPEVKGNIQKGDNLIRSLNGLICLGNVTCQDETPPEVVFSSPSGTLNTSSVTLNVTTDEASTCKYSTSDMNYFSMWDFFEGTSAMHYASLALAEGSHSYYVRCKDPTGNAMNASEIITFSIVLPDTIPPTVNLVSPLDTSSSANVTFKYNVSDDRSLIDNCELIINGTVNETDGSVDQNVTMNFTASLEDNSYVWRVNCTDSAGNENSSVQRGLLVDSAGPAVGLVSPEENFTLDTTNATFSYNVSDRSSVDNCSLIINASVNATSFQIVKDIALNFTATMSNGSYAWNVNCTDSLGNIGESERRNVTVSA